MVDLGSSSCRSRHNPIPARTGWSPNFRCHHHTSRLRCMDIRWCTHKRVLGAGGQAKEPLVGQAASQVVARMEWVEATVAVVAVPVAEVEAK